MLESVTIGGTNPDRGNPGRRPPWGVHPYEIALVGEQTAEKASLAGELLGLLGLQTAHLKLQSPAELMDSASVLEADSALVEVREFAPGSSILVFDSDLTPMTDPVFQAQGPLAVVGPWTEAPLLPWAASYFHRDNVPAVAAFIRTFWESQTAQRPIFGLVLTGGKSTRMGTDKAALAYQEQEESRRVFGLLGEVCSRVFVSCRADQADLPGRKGLPQIHDSVLDKGPVSGILSAFEAYPEVTWLVVACDLPRVNRDVLGALVAGRNPFKVGTAFRGFQNFPEPLCALYEPKARLRLWQFLAAGYDCPRKMMINSPVKILDPLPGDRLANVNSPDERDEVLRDMER